mmetsp:Transcript_3499/g.5699  ORF Transcript_3499/g.5699 Transcript_3499/m.5699 type:complete len:529 (-) Transcript_3499:56-1642(-)
MWSRPSIAGLAPSSRCAHTFTPIDSSAQQIYVFGGWNGTRMLNDMFVFSSENMTWNQVFPKQSEVATPMARGGHTTCASEGKLYVFGGGSGTHFVNDLHIFNTEQLCWEAVSVAGTAPSPRSRHTAAFVGRRMFVLFGGDDSRVYNDVHVYDADARTWHEVHTTGPKPSARWGHTTSILNDTQLVVIGGHDGGKMLNDVHVLDTGTMTWHRIDNPSTSEDKPPARAGHTAAAVGTNGIIALFGGGDGERLLNDTWLLSIRVPSSPSTSPKVLSPKANGNSSDAASSDTSTSSDTNEMALRWTRALISGAPPSARCAHTAVALEAPLPSTGKDSMALALPRGNKQQQRDRSPVGGRLLVFGGGDGGRRFKDVYLLDAQRLMANVPASSSLRANSGSPRVSAKERRKRSSSGARAASPSSARDSSSSNNTVLDFLIANNAAQYAAQFAKHDIDMNTIPLLTDAALQEIGVKTIGARLRLLKAAQSVHSNGAPTPQHVLLQRLDAALTQLHEAASLVRQHTAAPPSSSSAS